MSASKIHWQLQCEFAFLAPALPSNLIWKNPFLSEWEVTLTTITLKWTLLVEASNCAQIRRFCDPDCHAYTGRQHHKETFLPTASVYSQEVYGLMHGDQEERRGITRSAHGLWFYLASCQFRSLNTEEALPYPKLAARLLCAALQDEMRGIKMVSLLDNHYR